MNEPWAIPAPTIALPRIAPDVEPRTGSPTAWHDWTPLGPLPDRPNPEAGPDGPEPAEPQGAYRPETPEGPLQLPAVAATEPPRPAELLAPAGGPEAAFAAFHFGADVIYLGLKKFSARAEAV